MRRWPDGAVARLGAAALLSAAIVGAPLPALAQAPAKAADRQALVAGLEAQYEVSLIRERKMADDRETQQISVLEVRLRTARAQADSAKGDARQANAALAQARADYATLAGQIAARDPSTKADVTAYQAQAEHQAAQASPEKVAALQRFADGDRLGAWTTIRSIDVAEDMASGATAAAKAANARQLAELRDIMRAHGEATTDEVLSLYDQAAALDPSDFKVQVQRADLANDLGDLTRAKTAAKQALNVAVNDDQRALALGLIGDQAAAQGDNAEAGQDYDQALAIFQRVATADAAPFLQDAFAKVLEDKGALQSTLADYKAARASLDTALAIRQRLSAADPSNGEMQDNVTAVLQRIGDLDIKVGDLTGARDEFQQGYDIRQTLSVADPTNTDLQYYASALLRRLGDVAFQARDLATARKDYEAVLATRQRLSAANPTSAQIKGAVALDFFDLGEVELAQNKRADALGSYNQSLVLRQQLAAADPTNAPLQQLILRTLVHMAIAGDTHVGWPEVAQQYLAIKAAGHLIPADDVVGDGLRKRGLID